MSASQIHPRVNVAKWGDELTTLGQKTSAESVPVVLPSDMPALSVSLSGVSTLAEQQTQTTSLQLLDDIVQTEDEAHATGHKGVMILGRQLSSPAASAGTAGDYAAFNLNTSGELYVRDTQGLSYLININGLLSLPLSVSHSALSALDEAIDAQGEDALPGHSGIVALVASNSLGDLDYLSVDASGDLEVTVTNTAITIAHSALSALDEAIDAQGEDALAGHSGIVALVAKNAAADLDYLEVFTLAGSSPLAVAVVDSLGDQISTFGGGVQHAQDDGFDPADVGTLSLAVRVDTLTGIASNNYDFDVLQVDSSGRLKTAMSNLIVDDDLSVTQTETNVGQLACSINGALFVELVSGATKITETGGALDVNVANTVDTSGAIKDGDSSVLADVFDLTSSNPLAVAVVDGNGAQITSFGGGTQYTEGDTDSSITGTAIMWETSLDVLWTVRADRGLPVTLRNGSGTLLGTSSAPIQVQIGDGTDQATVSNLGATKALDVAVMDGSGTQITTFPVSHLALSALGDTITAQGESPGGGASGIVALVALDNGGAFDHLHLDASGYLNVNVAANAGLATETTLAAIEVDTGDVVASVELIDDVIQVDDGTGFTEGTSKIAMVGGLFQGTLSDLMDGDVGALRITKQRGMHTHLVATNGTSLLGQTTMSASVPVTTASDQVWARHAASAGTSLNAVNLNSTTEQNGTAFNLDMPRVCVYLSITKTGSPTRFQLFLQWSDDNSTYYKQDIGPYAIWEYGATEVSGTYTRCFSVPACGQYLKLSAQASGTANGSNYFTVTGKVLGVNP